MLNKIKELLGSAVNACTSLFIVVYLTGWYCNAVHSLKFDLSALQTMYLTVCMPLILKHATDSKYNSKEGEKP